jgi:hypothetical protein
VTGAAHARTGSPVTTSLMATADHSAPLPHFDRADLAAGRDDARSMNRPTAPLRLRAVEDGSRFSPSRMRRGRSSSTSARLARANGCG